jgi:predicted permease
MGWLNRFSNLFRRDRMDSELEEELQFHVEARVRDNLRKGMMEEAARYDARRRFGNTTAARERAHEVNIVAWMETLRRDLLYALRGLKNAPGFTTVAILTLALGFGANIAVFTVVRGVLLRPLPFPEPERLLSLSAQAREGSFVTAPGIFDRGYLAFQRQMRSFEQVATFGTDSVTLTGAGDAVRLPAAMVTASFFPVLEVHPALGRSFLPDEEKPGSGRTVVLSDILYRERFGANREIVGKTIVLDGSGYNVIGVMPAGFEFPAEAALWLPLNVGGDPNNAYIRPVIGRLRAGVTREQAQAELETFGRQMPMLPEPDGNAVIVSAVPLKDLVVGKAEKSLLIFMGAVGFVLLIVCANVANLLLMRGSSRQREIAVRTALGARRGRVIRQLLTESTLLSLGGSMAGILLALLAVPALLAMAPAAGIPRLNEIHVDAGVLGFALALGAVTGVLFGIVPALQATGIKVRQGLGQSGPTLTARRERLRGALVIAEIALALVLLTGAGLMLKSFVLMRSVDPGFRTRNILTMTVDLPDAAYPNAQAIKAFHAQVLEKLGSLPGVAAAGAVNWMPLQPALVQGDFHLDGGRRRPPGYIVAKPAVSPEYFSVMGIRLLEGRVFTAQDSSRAAGVAIVTQSMARTLWPGEDAMGKRITLEDDARPEDWLTIVGVVDDVRQQSLAEEPLPAIYQPLDQVTRPFFLNHVSYVVRTAGKPENLAADLRAVLRGVDSNQPVEIDSMTDLVEATTAETWFQARLISIFSVLALFLAAIGIYGVLAYAVTERTREIGIRMALGAKKGDIARMLLGRTVMLTAAGVVLGGCGALALTRLLGRFLFAIKADDPATFLAVVAILGATGLVAGLLPARRATRVDPVVALRWE